MNKYAITGAILFALFVIWYRGHTAYQDGYIAGQSEKYQEMLKSQQQKTVDLFSSNAYLSAQIEGMQNMLDDRNNEIKMLEATHQKRNGKVDEAIERNKKWACDAVPSDVADRLRTDADSREASTADRACKGAGATN